jgi:hypothetical protein
MLGPIGAIGNLGVCIGLVVGGLIVSLGVRIFSGYSGLS